MPRMWIVGEGTVGAWPPAWDSGGVSGPNLSLAPLVDGTVEIDTDADALTITVSAPAAYAGSWAVTVADLSLGPIPIVPPGISGEIVGGQTLSIRPGLWLYDGSIDAPVHSYQWAQDGADLSGETSADLSVPAGAESSVFSVRETASDTHGSRTASSSLGGAAAVVAIAGGFRADALPHIAAATVAAGDAQLTVEAA
ncbi:MAG: hypothetical protein AAGA71_19695 [Pseudomonadota bacterium]